MNDFFNFIGNNLVDFWQYTGFANATWGHIVMILVGCLFITLAIKKGWEPLLLVMFRGLRPYSGCRVFR